MTFEAVRLFAGCPELIAFVFNGTETCHLDNLSIGSCVVKHDVPHDFEVVRFFGQVVIGHRCIITSSGEEKAQRSQTD